MSERDNATEVCNECSFRIKPNNNLLMAMEMFANVLLWISGTLLAISPEMAKDSWELFTALFVGQVLWGVSAFIIRKWTLFASSVFFALLNVYGILVRI